MASLPKTHEPQRTLSTGFRGVCCAHSLDAPPAKADIGIWVADSICWAQRYAERKSAHVGGTPHVLEVSYALVNPLGLGDIEFEITNTPRFIALAKVQGYDGMIGWENGDSYQVTCIFDKNSIDSVKDITDKISEGWCIAGEGGWRTYKIVDMPIGSQVFPIVAGQVGVGRCVRAMGVAA